MNLNKKLIMKVVLGAIALVLTVVGVNKLVSNNNFSDRTEVMAMMESDSSLEEKMIFLEKRIERETGKLEMLMSYSDLCSNKYINELDTLKISIENTMEGFSKIEEDVVSSEVIVAKYENYNQILESYTLMVEGIKDEEYEDALESLRTLKELREEEFTQVDEAITKLGN